MVRGPLKMPINLAPLVKYAVASGLSLQQACSFYLGEGCYQLDAAEHLGKAIQAILPNCEFDFEEGGVMIARDHKKNERNIDLIALAGKLDPDNPAIFNLYRQFALRWDAKNELFGPAPLEREMSPIGMPAFIERRIRPVDHLVQHNASGALFEPLFDADGKRCDLCYTSECIATVVYVDPTKPRFKDIPNVDEARRLYYIQGGILPVFIEAQDALKFPGGMRGLLECKTVIMYGSDVSSLAGEAERASALAAFAEIPDELGRIHFYAFTSNCAVLSPRKLLPDELELVKSRVADFMKGQERGYELNLHFDLPRAQPKGTVLRRKK